MGHRPVLAILLSLTVIAALLIGVSLRLEHSPLSTAPPSTHDRGPSARPTPDWTATCSEPSNDGGVRWTVRYSVVGTSSPAPVRLSALGGAGLGAVPSQSSQPWVLSWTPPGADQPVTVTATASALSGRVVRGLNAELLVPDGACSLLISPPAPTAQHQVAIIGDSVFATVAKEGLGSTSAGQWQVVARSGFGWGASPTAWPLGTTHGTWAIGLTRGLIAEHVGALVIELGANDALRAAFAQATNDRALLGAIRRGVSDTVEQVLQEATAKVSCVVVVTAPTHASGLFGSGTLYTTQALAINAILRDAAARAGPSVSVADWAALSAAHHGPTALDGWFLPDDDVHPNPAGSRALVALVRSDLGTCASH